MITKEENKPYRELEGKTEETSTVEEGGNTAEQEVEAVPEIPEQTPEKIIPAEAKPAPAKFHFPSFKKNLHFPTAKDLVTIKIEKIMEEDLKDMYKNLPPIAQQEFKIKGEETAGKIRELLKSTHVKVKKIFQLMIEWMKVLPGINHFFLEQEAKIKTDKILMLNKK